MQHEVLVNLKEVNPMKKVLLALALLGLASGVMAQDPDNLDGGALICHYPEALLFSSDPPTLGWCGEYLANHAIVDHSEQVTMIDLAGAPYMGVNWFVIAAWTEDKVWSGTEFGMSAYAGDATFIYAGWEGCYPVGGLEVPSTNWPGPGEGISFVTSGGPWTGNYQPVMHFIGYAIGGANDEILLTGNMTATGFAGFVNTQMPPVEYPAYQLGGLGIDGHQGTYAQPREPQVFGACCLADYVCEILTEADCLAQQGEYLGDGTDCGPPNPCIPLGACCLPDPYLGDCQEDMSEADCGAIGGVWQGEDTVCDPNPCTDEWVCCVGDCLDECTIVIRQQDCIAVNGVFMPDYHSCTPNPCEGGPSATHDTSWGTIKSMYK
jgi:hypothetical protein